jgi:hypothetical protein
MWFVEPEQRSEIILSWSKLVKMAKMYERITIRYDVGMNKRKVYEFVAIKNSAK